MRNWLLCFCLWQGGFALPVGNPADPALYSNGMCCRDPCSLFTWRDAFTLRIGFYGDYIYNRHLSVQDAVIGGHETMRITSANNAGTFTLDICRNVEVSAILGTNASFMRLDGGAFSTSASLIDIEFATTFMWGVTAQGILWNPGNLYIGASMQYQRRNPRVKRIIRLSSADSMHFSGNKPALYDEWQVAFAAAYEICAYNLVLTPYMGLKASGAKCDFFDHVFTFQQTSITYTLKQLVSKKIWGYSIGLAAVLGERIGAAAEIRLADEKALAISGQFRF